MLKSRLKSFYDSVMANRNDPAVLNDQLDPNSIENKGKITSPNSEMEMRDHGQTNIEEIVNVQRNVEDVEEELNELDLVRPVFPPFTVNKIGVIVEKRKTYAKVEVDDDKQFDVYLDLAEIYFQPRKGDQVKLTINNDAEVVKMEPSTNKDITGTITSFNADEDGIINEQYFFFWDALDENYRTVNRNDKVRAKCIEYAATNCSYPYRCLKVCLEEAAVTYTMGNVDENRQERQTVNNNGIVVQDNISVELKDIETKQFKMMVKNISDRPRKVLKSRFIGSKSESQLTLISPNRHSSFTLQPNEEKEYLFKATSKYFGSATEQFSINFERINSDSRDFSISRFITVNVEDTKQLHPSIGTGRNLHKNYRYTRNVLMEKQRDAIPFVPIKKSPNFVKFKFEKYKVPPGLIDIVLGNFTRRLVNENLDDSLPFLKQSFQTSQYNLVFHHLLYLEELEMHHGMRKYDRDRVRFTKENDFLALTVLNVAETRPSLVIVKYRLKKELVRTFEQLGPIVLSRLDKSFLVRLLDQRPYLFDQDFENGYDPRLITRLIYNYRAMPSIMSVYSGLFYNNALKPMINDSDSEESKILARVASILPNYGDRDVTEGVIFIGVDGKNEQSNDSPSWFNKSEAESVCRFLLKLYRSGYDPKDIGIITPYMQQVKTIRTSITEADMCVPKIGTVEEFQGQERQIILLSTVRSTYRQMQTDRVHSLGFVRSPERMNVAISRARALLVVFGSAKLLARDENWKVLIAKCVENKCSVNCDPTILNANQDSDEDDE